MPEVRSYVPPDLWELGAEGRAAARALAVRLPGDCYLVASDEPKAVQTLRELGPDVAVDGGFREVARPRVWTDDHRAPAWAGQEASTRPPSCCATSKSLPSNQVSATLPPAKRKMMMPVSCTFCSAPGRLR
jgi:hypothetical protein